MQVLLLLLVINHEITCKGLELLVVLVVLVLLLVLFLMQPHNVTLQIRRMQIVTARHNTKRAYSAEVPYLFLKLLSQMQCDATTDQFVGSCRR